MHRSLLPPLDLSFELFPATTPASQTRFDDTLNVLAQTQAEFVSFTFGAGGSERTRTFNALERASELIESPRAGHLTCVGQSREETALAVSRYKALGVKHIVALRGDLPGVAGAYQPHPEGYVNAADLVAGLKKSGDFDISVAAYPEIHPASTSRQADLDNLKAKFDAGADRALTQFFFDNDDFLTFRDHCVTRGITGSIVPGIMLITNFKNLCNFARKCHAKIPENLMQEFAGVAGSDPRHRRIAVDYACAQIATLARAGQRKFHIYTMNDPVLMQDFLARIKQMISNEPVMRSFAPTKPAVYASA